jgi:hypothetical protein
LPYYFQIKFPYVKESYTTPNSFLCGVVDIAFGFHFGLGFKFFNHRFIPRFKPRLTASNVFWDVLFMCQILDRPIHVQAHKGDI